MSPAEPFLPTSGFAVLFPSDSTPPLAIALESDAVPLTIATDFGSRRIVYRRLRGGPLAYGLLEPFAPAPDDTPIEADLVTVRTHYRALIDNAASLFGAMDTQLHLPWRADGSAWRGFTVPLGRPTNRVRARFELDPEASVPHCYRLAGEEEDACWICPVCGKACKTREPHTAAHGVPGHIFAAESRFSYPSDVLDITRRVDDPNVVRQRVI